MKRIISAVLVFSIFSCMTPVFSADASTTPSPYTKDEFSPWLKDLRRAEIITLGAMPFVTLNVTLGFWALNGFDESLSPFAAADTTVTKYTNDQTLGILLTSIGICAGIGIADFLVHFLRTTDRTRKNRGTGRIRIESIADDPEATRIPIPFDMEGVEVDFSSGIEKTMERSSIEDFSGGGN